MVVAVSPEIRVTAVGGGVWEQGGGVCGGCKDRGSVVGMFVFEKIGGCCDGEGPM